jgi:DMSO/TMAO reductase YedYZ molybdopterin-dependent catalytic subunit
VNGLILPRRELIVRAGGMAAALPLLAACDRVNEAPAVRKILSMGEEMNRASQRALMDRDALAPEYGRADLSPVFRANGTRLPEGADYAAHAANGFADWRVRVSGLVARPLSLSLADHPPRLRRGLERDRRMDGAATAPSVGSGRGARCGALYRLSLCRPDRRRGLL